MSNCNCPTPVECRFNGECAALSKLPVGLQGKAEPIASRPIHLHLTELGAEALMRLAQKERRRCERMVEKNREAGWKPEPGHGDMNQIRLGNLGDLIDQLKAQLP